MPPHTAPLLLGVGAGPVIIGTITLFGCGYAFKKFVYDPHLSYLVEAAWADRHGHGTRVPIAVEVPLPPTSVGTSTAIPNGSEIHANDLRERTMAQRSNDSFELEEMPLLPRGLGLENGASGAMPEPTMPESTDGDDAAPLVRLDSRSTATPDDAQSTATLEEDIVSLPETTLPGESDYEDAEAYSPPPLFRAPTLTAVARPTSGALSPSGSAFVAGPRSQASGSLGLPDGNTGDEAAAVGELGMSYVFPPTIAGSVMGRGPLSVVSLSDSDPENGWRTDSEWDVESEAGWGGSE